MLSDPSITNPLPRASRARAIATVVIAAVGAAAIAFAFQVQDHARRGAPAIVTAPPVRAAAPAPDAWAFDHCPALVAAPPSPLDGIARAQAAWSPARDPELAGVSLDAPVIATWTARRVWLSVDGGAHWGRVLDAPGRVVAVHADRCGRVIVVRAVAGAPLALGTRIGEREQWRAMPAAAGGALLGLAADGPTIAIAARAIAAPGRDPDDAPAAIVTTDDRGARWSSPRALGDVAAAAPLLGRYALTAQVTPRGCPGPSPCTELRWIAGTGARDRFAAAIDLIDDAQYSKRWLFAPAAACGGALACWAFEGEPLAPVELAADPPAIARFVVTAQHVVFAIPADASRDLLAIRAGEARPVIGSAGFPATAIDDYGGLYGVRGAELLRLGVDSGVTAIFRVPGTPDDPPALAPSVAASAGGACPAATAIRTAAPHDQLWLVPLAVIASDRLALESERDLDVGAESHGDEQLRLVDPARARAAGAPPLPHDVWILGAGERASCRATVRGYYAAGDDLAQDSIVGAVVDGCPADLARFASLDADPGACKVATLAPAAAADLPADLAATLDGAYAPDDPRATGETTYVAYAVRVPGDGRGYAHVMVDAQSSGWRWLDSDAASVARPEVADDFSEAITALFYDATGPRLAFVDGDCRWSIATIGERGALSRKATRRLARSTCYREGNPAAAWLSPHEGDMLQTM